MNKAKLKSYAPQARQDFIAAVTARANLLGLSEKSGQLEAAPAQTQGDVTVIAGQAWPAKVAAQRDQLIARMKREGFAHTCEAVAYTWFNRFAALRYMELRDYLGHGHRALSSAEGNLPDILTHATDLAQGASSGSDSGLPGLNASEVLEMKLAGNRDGELYRLLLIAQCNALHLAMPFLFEQIDDETELLLPDNLLLSDSVVAKLVQAIPEDDWAEVEIIGWLYQFYISEKKDQVIGKVVKSEDIPAATQLFTPNWIVQYLVQNSVGRLWLMANPASTLASEWPYYIQPAEQTPEVQAQLDALIQTRIQEDSGTESGVLNPETITCLDPACGSGHILVVAYDVLKAIYLERGYRLRDIPRLILEKNLYGLDIDDRAAQMAGFALLMKARADDRRLFSDPTNPPRLHVLSLQTSTGLDADALARALVGQITSMSRHGEADRPWQSTSADANPGLPRFARNDERDLFATAPTQPVTTGIETTIAHLINTFAHAKTFGSLIQIAPQRLLGIRNLLPLLNEAQHAGDLYAQSAAKDLLPLVQQALVLGMQFDAVVANPPYMGGKGMNLALRDYAGTNFPDSKADLFAMFMERGFGWCKPTGFNSMVTMQSWMFLSSFEIFRQRVLRERTIQTLAHFGARAFSEISGEVVQTVASVFQRGIFNLYRPVFIRLTDGQESQKDAALQNGESRFNAMAQADLEKVPGWPIAYWVSDQFQKVFVNGTLLKTLADPKKGLATTDNNRFLRYWFEVSQNAMAVNVKSRTTAIASGKKWFPLNKGGEFRKWYGNKEYVINWFEDGAELKNAVVVRYGGGSYTKEIRSEDKYFLDGITWNALTSNYSSFRYTDYGAIFDSAGSSMVPKADSYLLLGLLNSPVIRKILSVINPTLNFGAGTVATIPVILPSTKANIDSIVRDMVQLTKLDWDSHETSWDFKINSHVQVSEPHLTLGSSHLTLTESWKTLTSRVKQAEEDINNCFIHAYGLESEISAEVPINEISLRCNPRYRFGGEPTQNEISQRMALDSASGLISYAIGCMMGRYSLDESGLIYAHAGNVGFDASRYATFPAAADGIVPITDALWFPDDAAVRVREFLLAVWGPDTLEENMAWLAESIGSKAGETPDESIRRYLSDRFYKDHLQTYKKRPIYWQFSSGKQGAFQALVYLHRYTEGTLARLRAEYVVPLTGKMQARLDSLEKDAQAASSTAARNKINKEIEKLKKKHLELLAYDEKLRHHADMRIALDLDDGVKVNYGKFGDLLSDVKAVTGGVTDD